MKRRLVQRDERAQQARRMRASFTEMSGDSVAAEDRMVAGALHYFLLGPLLAAGLAAVYYWWRGDEMTLGHFLAMGAAGAILGFRLWPRRNRRAAR
jgi:hypothetical protein